MIDHGTLESNVVRHCMNRCTACSHASPWASHYFMPPEVLAADLASLQTFLRVKQMYALGGEPLLHPQIIDILRVIKESGIAHETCVLTNGQLLSKMPEDFWKIINVLRISSYPGMGAELDLARQKAAQYGFYLGIDHISTFYRQFKLGIGGKHFAQCPWKGSCWTVHNGYFFLCPNAAFFPAQFMNLPEAIDGLPLKGVDEQQFSEFINRTKPLATCTICRAFVQQAPWTQSNSYDQWLKDSEVTI